MEVGTADHSFLEQIDETPNYEYKKPKSYQTTERLNRLSQSSGSLAFYGARRTGKAEQEHGENRQRLR